MNRRGQASSLATVSPRRQKMPKTYRHLYDDICAFENLHLAYLKARRDKRYRPKVLEFSAHLEEELLRLQSELMMGAYRTGEYRRFMVYEPKARQIAALPFRDRVEQHALCNVIEPIFDVRFIHDSYACRKGKGTHAGADRVTEFLRRAQREFSEVWVLKGDVAKYFPSVKHDTLLSIIGRTIRCGKTLGLIRDVVGSWHTMGEPGRGIPIGNLTSQLFANIYLNEFDQFVKHQLRQRLFVRYMDDFLVIGSNKRELHRIRQDIADFLSNVLSLRLNSKTQVYPAAQGIDFLGYRMWATHRLLRKSSVKRMRRKLKAFAEGYADGSRTFEEINASVQSWLGHAGHADTYRLRCRLFADFVLKEAAL